jgi:predicted DNA-binding transcriptional regulator AlpA
MADTMQREPLLLSASDAAALLSIGRAHFYAMHSSGRLGPMPIALGRRKLWSVEELREWVQAGCVPREKWQKREK